MPDTPAEGQIPSDRAAAAGARVEYAHTRWNFAVIVGDASSFITGLAFASPVVVLPLFVERLTGSTVLVGLMTAMQMAGWFLPQLLTASLVEHQPRKKPFMLKVCIIGRTPLILVPLALLALPDRPEAILAIFLSANLLFYLTDGMTGVPWTDIGAKTIPPLLRGRFFGSMQVVGGSLSVGAGLVVRQILGNPRFPYPRDYALLFFVEFALLMVSFGFLALIREPLRPVRPRRRGVRRLLRAAPALLRAKPQLIHMAVVGALSQMGMIAVPFYAIYAKVGLGAPLEMAGVFVSAQMAGGIASSVVWALLSDKRGSRRVIQGTALCSLAVPLYALLAPAFLRGYGASTVGYAYAATFFLMGAIINGAWIGYTNFVLDTVGDEERPSYLGLLNTLSAPLIALPVVGGWVVGVTSFQTVMAVAAASGALAVIASAWLCEPRERARRATPPAD